MNEVKRLNARHLLFINEMIRHGDKLKAYVAAYPDAKGEALRKAAERLLKNSLVAQQIDEVRAQIRHEAYVAAYAACLEDMKTELLSMQKRRAILAQLATCEMKVGRYVKYNGDYVMVYEDPRPRDIIRAIELDTKLEEACNTARRAEEKELSRYDIYIDGRPCDNPAAPVNPDIPMGLVMLPKKKSQIVNSKSQIIESPLQGPPVQNEYIRAGDLGVSEKAEQKGTSDKKSQITNSKSSEIQSQIIHHKSPIDEDILHKSFYKDYKQRIDNTPPTPPLTDEEIIQIKKQLNRTSVSTTTKIKYSTAGKLPWKDPRPQPGDMAIHKDDYSTQL